MVLNSGLTGRGNFFVSFLGTILCRFCNDLEVGTYFLPGLYDLLHHAQVTFDLLLHCLRRNKKETTRDDRLEMCKLHGFTLLFGLLSTCTVCSKVLWKSHKKACPEDILQNILDFGEKMGLDLVHRVTWNTCRPISKRHIHFSNTKYTKAH